MLPMRSRMESREDCQPFGNFRDPGKTRDLNLFCRVRTRLHIDARAKPNCQQKPFAAAGFEQAAGPHPVSL